MAGDWIHVCKGLSRKREVLAIAAATGRKRSEICGILIEFWSWVDDESADGNLPGMKLESLPLVIADSDNAFWLEVIAAGWLRQGSNGLIVPNFERWLGATAKRRMQDVVRQRRQREEPKIQDEAKCHAVVTEMSRKERDKSVTREEKRREEIGDESPNPSCPETPNASAGPKGGDGTARKIAPDRSGAANEVNDDRGAERETSEPPVLIYPTEGPVKEWPLRQADITELERLFPHQDVLGECRKALAWVLASPERRKTARGMRKFLTGWLTRSQDRGPPALRTGTTPRPAGETVAERIARIRNEQSCKRAGTTGPSTMPSSSG